VRVSLSTTRSITGHRYAYRFANVKRLKLNAGRSFYPKRSPVRCFFGSRQRGRGGASDLRRGRKSELSQEVTSSRYTGTREPRTRFNAIWEAAVDWRRIKSPRSNFKFRRRTTVIRSAVTERGGARSVALSGSQPENSLRGKSETLRRRYHPRLRARAHGPTLLISRGPART